MPAIGFRVLVERALPGTYAQIMEKSGLPKSTVKRWIKIMRAERVVYVSRWLRSEGMPGRGGQFMPHFVAGSRDDVPCKLKAYTSAETSTTFRKKVRADGRIAELRARNNSKKVANRSAKRCDPLVAALFGRRPAATKEVV